MTDKEKDFWNTREALRQVDELISQTSNAIAKLCHDSIYLEYVENNGNYQDVANAVGSLNDALVDLTGAEAKAVDRLDDTL